MAERFNYTNRRTIESHHVHVTLVRKGEQVNFTAKIDFAEYDFPPSARVFIEAYIKNHLIRFAFGTVGAFAAPDSTDLADFGDEVESVLYRVKVVAADEKRTILGLPSRGVGVRAENADGGASDCILPLGKLPKGSQLVWAMDYEKGYPRLCINRELEDQVARGDAFIALVYPAALRHVLEYTFLQRHDGQGCDWADDWKRFAAENLGEEYPALSGKPVYDEQDLQDLQDWIDAVVESFVDGADLVKKMNGGES